MAIEHVVCMKVREPLQPQALETIYRKCEASLERIPGVVTVSIGQNLKPENSGITHVMVIRLQDRKALDSYLPHPRHVAIGQLLQTAFSDFLVLDYETERA